MVIIMMMNFKNFVKKLILSLRKVEEWANAEQENETKVNIDEQTNSNNSLESIYEKEEVTEVHTIWDFLDFKEGTQAFYVTKVVGYDEWVPMDEIRRRIFELFGISFKNERSLYSYIKTLVDCGLLEFSDHGGQRKWRKKDLIIKFKRKKKEKEAEQEIAVA